MLVTNQRLDKLAAARVDFQAPGMLDRRFGPPDLPPDPPANNLQDEEEDDGGAVDGDIDSEVILAQIPSESPEQIFISPWSLIAVLLNSSKSSSHGWRSLCPSQYPSPSQPRSALPSWTIGTSWRKHRARWCSAVRLSCPYQHHENPCFSFCGCHLLCPKWLVWHKGDVSWTYSGHRLLAAWSCKTRLCFRSTWSRCTRFPWAVRCVGTPFFFHSSQQDPLSMCVGLLVFNYWYHTMRRHWNVEGRTRFW